MVSRDSLPVYSYIYLFIMGFSKNQTSFYMASFLELFVIHFIQVSYIVFQCSISLSIFFLYVFFYNLVTILLCSVCFLVRISDWTLKSSLLFVKFIVISLQKLRGFLFFLDSWLRNLYINYIRNFPLHFISVIVYLFSSL